MKSAQGTATTLARTVLFAAMMIPGAVAAQPTFSGLLHPLLDDPTCRSNDQPTFRLFECGDGLTLWYVTKPSHPAYPAIIKRTMSNGPAGWSAHEDGWSFASNDKQAPFLAWMAQIKELDEQMKAALARAHGGNAQ